MPTQRRLNVAFLNENMLGHSSYLPPFAHAFAENLELGIDPHLFDIAPLPPNLDRIANRSIRILRRWGLDFAATRWRNVASAHARALINDLLGRVHVHAIVVNTQSIALDVGTLCGKIPVFVCLDATYLQMAREGWFASNRVGNWCLPLTIGSLLRREEHLFSVAHRLLPWSKRAEHSLLNDYKIPATRIHVLPPSIRTENRPERTPRETHPMRVLFVGGDFERKNGRLLLECYRKKLSAFCELHVVTHSDVPQEPGVYVYSGIKAQSREWHALWRSADVFVFPSKLETFGIVILEALTFGVPVIASDVGSTAEMLGNGDYGCVLNEVSVTRLAEAIANVKRDPATAKLKANHGFERIAEAYSLSGNTKKLAGWIRNADEIFGMSAHA